MHIKHHGILRLGRSFAGAMLRLAGRFQVERKLRLDSQLASRFAARPGLIEEHGMRLILKQFNGSVREIRMSLNAKTRSVG
jgi:hypothetical protein